MNIIIFKILLFFKRILKVIVFVLTWIIGEILLNVFRICLTIIIIALAYYFFLREYLNLSLFLWDRAHLGEQVTRFLNSFLIFKHTIHFFEYLRTITYYFFLIYFLGSLTFLAFLRTISVLSNLVFNHLRSLFS